MARMRKTTADFVRTALMRAFRKNHIPNLVAAVAGRVARGEKDWRTYTVNVSLEAIRPGVEMMDSIPAPARRKRTQLEEYAAELKKWRRMRTTARAKVAKYSRLVRYHRSLEQQPEAQP